MQPPISVPEPVLKTILSDLQGHNIRMLDLINRFESALRALGESSSSPIDKTCEIKDQKCADGFVAQFGLAVDEYRYCERCLLALAKNCP